jgi:hypothetical protein
MDRFVAFHPRNNDHLTQCMPACRHALMQPKLPGIVAARARRGQGEGKEPLQVRIPSTIKRRFKIHAAMRGIEPNELFVEVWHHYENSVLNNRELQGANE